MEAAESGSPVAEVTERAGKRSGKGGPVDDSFMLVPHGYEQGARTRVWVGAHGEQAVDGLWLRCEPLVSEAGDEPPASEPVCRDIPLQLDRQAEGLSFTLVSVPTAPGCHYRLSLWRSEDRATGAATVLAHARCRGKPDSLDQGFNIWYGTCFYRHTDHGALTEAFHRLPSHCRPDVSFLGGDQVYLDTAYSNRGLIFTPGFSTANFSPLLLRSPKKIRRLLNRIFTREYRETWAGALRNLLSSGHHYFLAGDHEFWNDYPNPPGFLPTLWSGKVRGIWNECARKLFDAYQLPEGKTSSEFEVGDDLGVFVLDTRLQRGRGRDSQFTDPATMQRLQDWLKARRTPGVLVLPAPILTRWQFRGVRSLLVKWGLGDHTLADTGQYETLVRALNDCSQDILILAGDVHFSRLARFELNGKQVVEVVSSPLSCLPSAAAAANEEPGSFPDRPAPGIRAQVEYLKAGTTRRYRRSVISNNNFVTLNFTRAEAGVAVNVVCWNINARNERGELIPDWQSRGLVLRASSCDQTERTNKNETLS
ncbi:hypothetical protein [uncultured Microbulbifer sp.]|uniref:hypothetical protein n=1 Tax=uncultured Microbulbifer sp. TaxID=348147 RepID=UPI0026369EB6|nr:hypothetical protein [uncultured Microbulbifer sp.]